MAPFTSNHTCLCNQHTGKYSLKFSLCTSAFGRCGSTSWQSYPSLKTAVSNMYTAYNPHKRALSSSTILIYGNMWSSERQFCMQVVIHIASWIICGTIVTNNGLSCMFFFNKTCLSLSVCLMSFWMIHPPSHRSSTDHLHWNTAFSEHYHFWIKVEIPRIDDTLLLSPFLFTTTFSLIQLHNQTTK